MGEWDIKSEPLSNLAKIFSGGTPKTSEPAYWNGVYPWLSSGETSNRFIDKTEKTITEQGIKNSSTKLAFKNDIVIASAGQGKTRGQTSFCNIDTYINQSIVAIRAEKTKIDPKWLFYNLNSRYNEMRSLSDSHSIRGSLTTKLLGILMIHYPPLPIQKKIAHILSTLDDKIELNRKMNETLEAMAQAIFKSWFVDFDPVHAKAEAKSESDLDQAAKTLGISREILDLFPSKLVESEMGLIPEGWSIENMQNIISVKDGTHDSPKPKEKGYPLVTSKHIKNGEIELDTPKLISKEDFDKVNKRSKVEQYDILIGMIGTIGDLYLVSDDEVKYAIKNIGLFKTSEVEELSEYIYYWLDTPLMRNYIISRLAGTTQKYISLTELRKLPVLLPTDNITAKFRELVGSTLSMKRLNFDNSRELINTRDTLLPKLLSGELNVSVLELDISCNE